MTVPRVATVVTVSCRVTASVVMSARTPLNATQEMVAEGLRWVAHDQVRAWIGELPPDPGRPFGIAHEAGSPSGLHGCGHCRRASGADKRERMTVHVRGHRDRAVSTGVGDVF